MNEEIERLAPASVPGMAAGQVGAAEMEVPAEPVVLAPLQPVAAAERLELLDMLRGLALFGIIVANMRGFNAPEPIYFDINFLFQAPWDVAAQQFVNAVFVGKFLSLFSFMFGLGFAVQFTRGMEKGRPEGEWFGRHVRKVFLAVVLLTFGLPLFFQLPAKELPLLARLGIAVGSSLLLWGLYLLGFRTMGDREREFSGFFSKRLILLYLLGWLHVSLIWWGDVLTQYAIAGFFLLLFRKSKPKTLLIWSIVVAALPLIAVHGQLIFYLIQGFPKPPADNPAADAKRMHTVMELVRLFSTGAPWALVAERSRLVWSTMPGLTYGTAVGLLPCFLFGLYVWRKRIIQNLEEHLPMIRKVCIITGIITVCFWIFGWIVPALVDIPRGRFTWLGYLRSLARNLNTTPMALFYLSGFVLATRNAAVYRFFQPCGAIGRLSLSNYLLQSLIGMLLFTSTGLGLSGYGWMLYGKVGPAWDLVIATAIYLLQIPLSLWYLQRYRIGPAEWLWRSLAYGRWQKLRREDLAAAAA